MRTCFCVWCVKCAKYLAFDTFERPDDSALFKLLLLLLLLCGKYYYMGNVKECYIGVDLETNEVNFIPY